jgi:hypothetical protein
MPNPIKNTNSRMTDTSGRPWRPRRASAPTTPAAKETLPSGKVRPGGARPKDETTPIQKGKGLYRRGEGLKGVHPEVHGSVGPYDLPAINTGKTTVTPKEQSREQKLNSSGALNEAREALKPAVTKAREIARDTAGNAKPVTRPATPARSLKPSAGLNPVKPVTQTQGRKKNDPWNSPW